MNSDDLKSVNAIQDLITDEQSATQIVFNFGKRNELHHSSTQPFNHSPGEDDFEDNNASDEIHDSRQQKQITTLKGNNKKLSDNQTSNEESPNHRGDSKMFKFHEDLALHKDAYEKVYKYYPPNPILPKTFQLQEGSPRKLIKFRGKDFGKSKFEIDYNVNHVEFPENCTLKSIFSSSSENEENKTQTPFGEIVFIRSVLDFTTKNNQPGTKKDEVLEENLIDVRRILKNSTQNKANENIANKEITGGSQLQGNANKKGLINLHGVDQFYKKKDQFDKTLIFESRFESGNLASALKVNDNEYHLLLQNDVNTSGHTQWFFFRVQNTRKYQDVRFNMLNLSKPDSLFNEGMKVLVYSEKQYEDKDIGWHRSCNRISYYQNGIRKESQKRFRSYYTLTFSYEFQYDDDTVYFAYCYPYTYTDLLDDLNRISADPIKSQFCTRKTLCLSVAENKVEMLTITSKQNLETLNKRKGIFLTARVHPGESVGSWMMKGAIEFLTDETSEEAEILRQNFVFKVIPMLNPDGVINGNYRCSLAGCDLNRRWKAPSKVLHPCIYYTKQLMQNFAKEREMLLFCDFHGHSRRKNIFMYGCHVPAQPEDTRLFPFILSKICPYFSYNYSRFGNQKSKEATARVAMFNELKIPAIYTMESSFCGNDQGPYANYHFSTINLMQTGRDFCRSLFVYCNLSIPQPMVNCLLTEILQLYQHYKDQNELKDALQRDKETEQMKCFQDKIQQLKDGGIDINCKQIKKALLNVLRQTQDYILDGETTSSAGSDQAPSEDNLEPEEIQQVVPVIDDDQFLKKGLRRPRKDQAQLQETATSISPMRKKTMVDINSSKRGSTIIKPNKRMSMLKNQQNRNENNSSSKVQLTGSRKNTLDDNRIDEETENVTADRQSSQKDAQSEQLGQEPDDTVTHKKKRKRNVESRDAWTQTDRSDYMLIKYRQKQKQALQMAKSQKCKLNRQLNIVTKEEQLFYEQVLAQQNQQAFHINKTQEVMTTQSSVNMALSKMMKSGSGVGTTNMNSSVIPQRAQYSQQSPNIQSNNYQDMSQAQIPIKMAGNFSNSSNHPTLLILLESYLRKQSDQNQNSGTKNSAKHSSYSRNVQSSQSNQKNRPKITSQQIASQDNNPLQVKTQQPPVYDMLLKNSMDGQQQFNQQYPYQQHNHQHHQQQLFSNTQELKNIEKIDYQSNKLNTIGGSNSHKGNINNQQSLAQTVFPSIQTPNQIVNNKKLSNLATVKKSVDQQQQQPITHPSSAANQAFIYTNNNNMRMLDSHSEMSSNHSTQRVAANSSAAISSNKNFSQTHKFYNMNSELIGVHHNSFIEQPTGTAIKNTYSQNINNIKYPKSLPPKPNNQVQMIMKSSTNSSDIVVGGVAQEQIEDPHFNNSQAAQLGNLRVLENAYIQQKLMQQQEAMNQGEREYETIRLGSGQNNQRLSAPPKSNAIMKGNFFQNASQVVEQQQYQNQTQQIFHSKHKNKSDIYGNSKLMTNVGMQGQSIKKMIENSWKAVQQQHQMSQSFYQGQTNTGGSQTYGQSIFGPNSFNNQNAAFLHTKQQTMTQHRNSKKQQQLLKTQPQHNQFINVSSIMPVVQQTTSSGQNSTAQGNGKVKISIVNVQNDLIDGGNHTNQVGQDHKGIIYYNIHNNIIINNSSASLDRNTKINSKQTSASKGFSQKKR